MEILEFDHQYYIRMSDLKQGMELNDQQFTCRLEQYTFQCKPLENIVSSCEKFVACKSACHFIEWYLDHCYKVMPTVNQFKHDLKKYSKKIPKRKLSRSHRIEIAYRQEYKCRCCKILLPPDFHIDHIVALEDGGLDVASNLQALCVPCHSEKTRLNRLRKCALFKQEASIQHEKFAVPVQNTVSMEEVEKELSDDSDEDDLPKQVFSKYFLNTKE